jgi:hypothetical protein
MTVVISGFLVNLLLGYSLSLVWQLINGIQIANHYPMLIIDSPPDLALV